MKTVLLTPPTIEPVTRAEVKNWARQDAIEDDLAFDRLIRVARGKCEKYTGRAFLTQTWQLVLDGLDHYEVRLPKPPCQSITSFTYIDYGGNVQPYTAFIGTTGEPGRIQPNYGTPWPIYRPTIEPITIQFVAGWTDPSLVPDEIVQAIMVYSVFLYENRGDENTPIPVSVTDLLAGWIWEV